MRFVDLSLPITADMPGVEISIAKRLEVDGWNATTLKLYSHCGTHIDAPLHFLPDGHSLEKHSLETLIGPAQVINLAPVEPRQLLTVDDLINHDKVIGPGTRLLLRTDWYQRYGTPAYRHELPRISLELAQWLVQRQVALVGVEPPSVADVNNMQELTDVHQTLFRGGVVIVEGLANLDKLTTSVVEFMAVPLRIVGGDGCPVRALARELDN